MRFAFFTLVALGLVCTAGLAQDAKKKKDEKAADSKKMPEVTEVAGKKLDEWIKDISSKDPSRREHAMRMILGFGAKKCRMRCRPSLLS